MPPSYRVWGRENGALDGPACWMGEVMSSNRTVCGGVDELEGRYSKV